MLNVVITGNSSYVRIGTDNKANKSSQQNHSHFFTFIPKEGNVFLGPTPDRMKTWRAVPQSNKMTGHKTARRIFPSFLFFTLGQTQRKLFLFRPIKLYQPRENIEKYAFDRILGQCQGWHMSIDRSIPVVSCPLIRGQCRD